MSKEFKSETEIRVRYAHTDKMGIVYNGNYLTFFEIGRTEMLRSMGLPYVEIEKAGFLLPVLEAHVVYKSPAFYDDLLTIESVVDLDLKSTLTITYTVTRQHHIIATGFTKHSFVAADSWRATKPPAIFVQTVQGMLNKAKNI